MGRLHFRFTQDIIVVVALVILSNSLANPRANSRRIQYCISCISSLLQQVCLAFRFVWPFFTKNYKGSKASSSLPKPLHAGTPRRGYIFHLIAEVLWHRLASVGSDLNIREVCS